MPTFTLAQLSRNNHLVRTRPPVKGKHNACVGDALLATVARHLAKADPATREAVLEAVRDLALEPSGETVRPSRNGSAPRG